MCNFKQLPQFFIEIIVSRPIDICKLQAESLNSSRGT